MTNGYSEQDIEAELQAKGLTAPRITPDQVNGKIRSAQYHVFPGTALTVCCLTLDNGYNVLGQSAAASPANFDEEIGRKLAHADARDKIWALEGYLLREKITASERAVTVVCSSCSVPYLRQLGGMMTHPDPLCPVALAARALLGST
jgi:hypothetical protein